MDERHSVNLLSQTVQAIVHDGLSIPTRPILQLPSSASDINGAIEDLISLFQTHKLNSSRQISAELALELCIALREACPSECVVIIVQKLSIPLCLSNPPPKTIQLLGELFGLQLVSGVNKELIQDFLLSLLRPADTSSIANIPTQISSTLLIGLVREASSELYEFVAALADVFVTGIIASHDPRALGLRNSLSQMFVPSLYSWLREMRPEGFSELLSKSWAMLVSLWNHPGDSRNDAIGLACVLYDYFVGENGALVEFPSNENKKEIEDWVVKQNKIDKATKRTFSTGLVFDIRGQRELFDMILYGLVHPSDPLIRKRSSYLLKRCIETSKIHPTVKAGQWPVVFSWSPAASNLLASSWNSFFLIYETLNEFDLHIVKPVWPHLKVLFPPEKGPAPIDPSWTRILIRSGFSHKNPVVRKFCVLHFLADCASPRFFQVFDSTMMFHLLEQFTDSAIFTATNQRVQSIKRIVAGFFTRYITYLESGQQASFIRELLARVIKLNISTAGLECVLVALGSLPENLPILSKEDFAMLLTISRVVIPPHHFKLHPPVYAALLRALPKIMSPDITFDNMRQFIRSIPPAFRRSNRSSIQKAFDFFGHNWVETHLTRELELYVTVPSGESISSDTVKETIDTASELMELLLYLNNTTAAHVCASVFKVCLPLAISVERVRQLALLHSAVKVILEFKEEKLWVGGPSPDAAVSELHRFFQTSNIFTAPIDVVRDPVSFDELEAEVEIMSAACELAQTVTAVHCSAGLDDSIRTLFSHVSNSSESTTTSELRRYASLLGLSKLLSANHIATVGLKPAFFVQLIRGALQANVSVPSTEQNDYICRKMKKIAADNGLDAKWQVVSTSLKLAYRALAKSGSSQQLELKLLCSDLGEMFDRVAESIELATENSVGHICASLRRIVLLAAEVSPASILIPSKLKPALDCLWNTLKQWKDFSSRKVNMFTAIAMSPYLMRSDDTAMVALVKEYFNRIVSVGTLSMGTVNALAVRFLKAFERPAQYEVANRFWVDEIVMFSMYGMDRKGQTEPLTDHRANSGYTGPRQDYYARALINRFIIDAVIAASSGDHRAQCLVDSVFSKVLDASFHSSDIEGHELYRNGYPYRKLMRCWQTMCLLAEGISHSCFEASASSIWRTYEQQSETSVRSMVSVFLAIAFRRFPSSADPHLVELMDWANLVITYDGPQRSVKEDVILSSIALAGSILAQTNTSPDFLAFYLRILHAITPYLTVNTLYLRGVVQEVVRQLFRSSTAEELLRQRVDGSLFNVLKSFCELIDATLVHTVDTKKKQRRECLVAHLFQLAERPHRPVTMDEMRLVCEVAFVEQAALNAFESSELFDLDMTFQPYSSVKALTISVMSAPGADELVDIVLNDNSCPVPITGLLEELDLTVSTEADQQNYQKKIVPWQQMDISGASESSSTQLGSKRQEIIVVASMVKKSANLGGLTRTAEIFQASQLVIPSKLVLQDRVYQQLCVTADKWVPMIEVPEHQLKEYLLAKKTEGFSLVGAEQTADSVSLTKFQWPLKTVLVLGDEKHGIPAPIIALLDYCVEIPQLGVVRSLNVHVTGSIMLWEYTRRHALTNDTQK